MDFIYEVIIDSIDILFEYICVLVCIYCQSMYKNDICIHTYVYMICMYVIMISGSNRNICANSELNMSNL
jgi:hypothetical protein